MNLTTDPWIPAVDLGGHPVRVSLLEVFQQGEKLRDLTVRPHERVALMRLLICIVQAALDGPDDHDDWQECKARIIPSIEVYLERWKSAFELFGERERFLQVANLKEASTSIKGGDKASEDGGSKLTSKLDLALASGNNSTVFDNSGGSARSFTPGELALMLLTFQCFSPGGQIGLALWNQMLTNVNGSSSHAPCIAKGMLHSLIRGADLLDSVHLNLLPKETAARFHGPDSWGKPVWERMPNGPNDKPAVENATMTYLGRLVPLARAIRLANDGVWTLLANGLDYPKFPEWREASATVVARPSGKETSSLLSVNIEKATWRQLHSLAVKSISQASVGGPAALANLTDEHIPSYDLWAGGIVADQAKLIDTVESIFHVPSSMFESQSQKIYESGINEAERLAKLLASAVSAYHKELGAKLDRAELKNRLQRIQRKATTQFWTDAENSLPQLFRVIASPELLGVKGKWHKTPWGRSLWKAAFGAYKQACPHQTSRQIRAHAQGLRVLTSASKSTDDLVTVETSDNEDDL